MSNEKQYIVIENQVGTRAVAGAHPLPQAVAEAIIVNTNVRPDPVKCLFVIEADAPNRRTAVPVAIVRGHGVYWRERPLDMLQPNPVHLVIVETGEYEDYDVEILAAYSDEETAKRVSVMYPGSHVSQFTVDSPSNPQPGLKRYVVDTGRGNESLPLNAGFLNANKVRPEAFSGYTVGCATAWGLYAVVEAPSQAEAKRIGWLKILEWLGNRGAQDGPAEKDQPLEL